jgi:hypothetical protein
MERGETFLGGRVWEEKHWLKGKIKKGLTPLSQNLSLDS